MEENYNDIPVYYCRDCLSLKIGSIVASQIVDYCMDCGSTNIDSTHINNWETLYEDKYKTKFISNGRKEVYGRGS